MHMKYNACLIGYTWKRCEVSTLRKGEPSQEMDLCSMTCAFPNAKVRGVLMMLSLMKLGKKFEMQ